MFNGITVAEPGSWASITLTLSGLVFTVCELGELGAVFYAGALISVMTTVGALAYAEFGGKRKERAHD